MTRCRKIDHRDRRSALSAMRLIPLMLTLLFAGGAVLSSCDDEKKEVIHVDADPEKTPTMKTTDVATLISDSGITRYKITAPLWLAFEEAKEPKWTFPKGLHLDQYDLRLKPQASVECDSAIFYKGRQLWQLDGYVNIHNTLGDKFLTSRLYWDQRQQKIYGDSFIHIERDGKIIEGYGFESNENMTNYNVKKVSGIFPAEKFTQPASRPDSAAGNGAPRLAPPPPGAPPNPGVPNAIVRGQADESRIKGRKNLDNSSPTNTPGGAILHDKRLVPSPQTSKPAPNSEKKPSRSPLSR